MWARGYVRRATSVAGLLLALAVCSYAYETAFDRTTSALVAVFGCLGTVPVVIMGRMVLDERPTPARAGWVTALVHYDLMVLFGPALIEAVQSTQAQSLWPIPFPEALGMLLTLGAGLVVTAAMVNLAVSGVGAPFAVVLSYRLAVDGLYAWTRNPMVLGLLLFLLSLGLWLGSGLFLLWTLAVFAPATMVFLLVYEERELEIRFGARYLEYKARTPLLWPRYPGGAARGGVSEWT